MNQYHIYEKIGKGKHTTVYKGRKKKTIQYYAIKSVEKVEKPRVLQEVRTMHNLDHPNILRFFAWYETTNHLWLILEYCVGGDLMSLLRQDVKLPESSVHDFGRDLLTALQYLHHNSIVYCDLKPSNILLDENGRLKLGGFGLSRRLSEINKTPLAVLPPAKRGTPCYMAPELFSDGATHSTASDLWAFGCVLYECAAGRPPFINSSFNQLVQEILEREPAPVPAASAEFTHLLSRLLDKNPATRLAWAELAAHPFWQKPFGRVDMPPEPALAAFIKRFNLAPSAADRGDPRASAERAKAMRASVDVTRLSRIALNNLEKDGDGQDYAVAAESSSHHDIKMESADAELDFEEAAGDDGGGGGGAGGGAGGGSTSGAGGAGSDDEDAMDAGVASTSGAGDDGSMMLDQSAGAGVQHAAGMGLIGGEAMRKQAQASRQRGAGSPTVAAGGNGAIAGGGPPARGAPHALAGPAAAQGLQQRLPNAVGAGGGTAPSTPLTARGGGADVGGPSGLASPPAASTSPAALLDLIWHPTDNAVKPIVNNRRIEKLPEPKYEAKGLPFAPLSLADMLAAEQQDLEAFLTHIYRAVASAAPLKDKVNVLSYFETLCCDTNAANVLINSSLTILFIRMLRNARAPTLRVRLASVLGLLVRHATYIAEELAATGVLDVLCEALKDKNERVRRRVMATLGELLFYIITQQQDAAAAAAGSSGGGGGDGSAAAAASSGWTVSSSTISAVVRLTKANEDEVAQHYAVKTIENVCSQGGEWAARFGNQDVVFNLVQIYNTTKTENLKATAASALYRLLRHSPAMVGFVVDKFGLRMFISGLGDASSKVQTGAVNVLNLALSQPDLSVRAKSALAEEASLVTAVMALMDHSLPLLRAKGVVTVLLLCRLSTRWLLDACRAKLVPVLEKLQREREEHLQAALECARSELAALVPAVCAVVGEELSRGPGSARKAAPGAPLARPASHHKNPLHQFQVLLHLLTSPMFRAAVVTPKLLQDLASYVTATAGPAAPTSVSGVADFKATLMHVLEALCQQVEIILPHHGPVLSHLLPALCDVIAATGESGDARFFCLRMASDVLQVYLLDPDLYGSQTPSGFHQPGRATAAIDGLLQRRLLPLVPALLRDEDPMPLYALKLLSSLVDVNPRHVADVERMGLSQQFFEFLSLEHANNNVHNIRLCRQLVANGGLSGAELSAMGVGGRVAAVLTYAHDNNVEPFLEPVLELCHTIVRKDAADARAGRSAGAMVTLFGNHAHIFLELSSHPDVQVCTAAAANIAQLVALYPTQCAPWLLSSEGAAILTAVLMAEHLEGSQQQPTAQFHANLLQAVTSAITAKAQIPASTAEMLALLKAVQHVAASSGDASVRAMAADTAGLISSALQ